MKDVSVRHPKQAVSKSCGSVELRSGSQREGYLLKDGCLRIDQSTGAMNPSKLHPAHHSARLASAASSIPGFAGGATFSCETLLTNGS